LIVTDRLSRLERILGDRIVSAMVILTREKFRRCTEIVLHVRADHTFKGRGEGAGWPLSIRQAVAKIEHQAQKLKSKYGERKRAANGTRAVKPEPAAPAAAGSRLLRARRYAVKPMSVDDAALRLEGASESFVVFRSAEREAISILYRRKDGNLGLIEPD
jgi:putative sigma-54 modulation protein